MVHEILSPVSTLHFTAQKKESNINSFFVSNIKFEKKERNRKKAILIRLFGKNFPIYIKWGKTLFYLFLYSRVIKIYICFPLSVRIFFEYLKFRK